MILTKYQKTEESHKRGYSSNCIVQNERQESFFAKWIHGLKEHSQAGKMLLDKLRNLKRAKHECLPEIIEFGFDKEEGAYCIIFQYLQAQTLEEVQTLHSFDFLRGMTKIVDCLRQLSTENNITHGDINPANLLIGNDNRFFYLVDFGISDLTIALSQAETVEVFARHFAAPEKFDKTLAINGFPFQADIYSIGKVIAYYFDKKGISYDEDEKMKELLAKITHATPSERGKYEELKKGLEIITHFIAEKEDAKYVFTTFKTGQHEQAFLAELNDTKCLPIFDISPNAGNNIQLNISTNNFHAIGVLWLISDKKLLLQEIKTKNEDFRKWENTQKRGKKIELPLTFLSTTLIQDQSYDLTAYLKQIQIEKQQESTYRKRRENVMKELDFYKELLEKEKEVMFNNSLRLKYAKLDKKNEYEFELSIEESDKFSSVAHIYEHLDNATDPKSEGYEYFLSSTADSREMKKKENSSKFCGIAFDYDQDKKVLKFKDCEKMKWEEIPPKGYLFQDISQQEEEKKRQLEAISKVEKGDVQNKEMIHYLFHSQDLQGEYLNKELEKVYQTAEDGTPYTYSYNQQKAILNAVLRKPLTVIQGPPGTGKTTVITEIILQLLAQNPDAKILITSQTNDAVDNVLQNLLKKNVPFVRLSGLRQPKEVSLQKHTLDKKMEGWKKEIISKSKAYFDTLKKGFFEEVKKEYPFTEQVFNIVLNALQWHHKKDTIQKMLERDTLWKNSIPHLANEATFIQYFATYLPKVAVISFFEKRELHKEWLVAIQSLDERSEINNKLIDSINVIGATCNHIASKKYQKFNFQFDYVIMDESGKATPAESLVPIVLGTNAILVGDHRQLRPTLTSSREVEKWLREKYKTEKENYDGWDDYFNRPSLFEQVIMNIDDNFKSQLTECRRCSEEQVALISACFYEPYGDEPIEFVPRNADKEHNLDLKVASSIFFIDIGRDNRSQTDKNGSSYNVHSAKLIPEVLQKLDIFPQIQGQSIGIITGYTAQLRKIQQELNVHFSHQSKRMKHINLQSEGFTVSVVDRFQGLEKDIIIFDLVRTGHDQTLGFLANANRINVALSRQSKLLIIIGDRAGILSVSNKNGEQNPLQHYIQQLKPHQIITQLTQIFS